MTALLLARRENLRACAYARPLTRLVYRTSVLGVGSALVLVGLVLVPLPGPGWLIVAMGLALLSEDFPWAAVPARQLGRAFALVRGRCARWRYGTAALGAVFALGLAVPITVLVVPT